MIKKVLRTSQKWILACFAILAPLQLSSCEKLILGVDPESTLESNFESFWKGFDKHYAFF
jgi:hypothetical protein